LTKNTINDCEKQYLLLSAGSAYVPAVNENEEKQGRLITNSAFQNVVHIFSLGRLLLKNPQYHTIDLTRVCLFSNECKQTAASEQL
jgi:hypothetical protein